MCVRVVCCVLCAVCACVCVCVMCCVLCGVCVCVCVCVCVWLYRPWGWHFFCAGEEAAERLCDAIGNRFVLCIPVKGRGGGQIGEAHRHTDTQTDTDRHTDTGTAGSPLLGV